MTFRLAALFSIISTVLLLLVGTTLQTTVVSAQPPFQRATAEPIKPPYVFPTPIFIPTYPGDTPIPAKAPAGTPVSSSPAGGASSGERTYTVVAGDNPSRISMKVYGVASKWDVIMQANGIADPTKLKVGMVLKIPPADTAGQPLRTPAAAVAPTTVPPTVVAPTPSALTTPAATPSGTRTPTPGSTAGSSLLYNMATVALNVLIGFFLIGSLGAAFLSYLVYRRTHRFAQMNMLAKRIRLR